MYFANADGDLTLQEQRPGIIRAFLLCTYAKFALYVKDTNKYSYFDL